MNKKMYVQKYKQQKKTVGKAVFKNLSANIQKVIQQSKWIQQKLKNKLWIISDGHYQIRKWRIILPHMIECLAQRILYGNNKRFQIILQIKQINYSNLKQLELNNNKITNIQSLCSFYFPKLQHLNLGCNQINQIKCMNRLSTPFLNRIYLYQNPINEMNFLNKSKINSENLQMLSLSNDPLNNPIPNDLSFIVKLGSDSVEQFNTRKYIRISQDKVLSMLKLKLLHLINSG